GRTAVKAMNIILVHHRSLRLSLVLMLGLAAFLAGGTVKARASMVSGSKIVRPARGDGQETHGRTRPSILV
ncbi:MAG TPA: hypothetical protein VGS41_08085, partial [Chthonomonadales bacterium]|nr:hypothetical protein [Chthonomonadales bacterium]